MALGGIILYIMQNLQGSASGSGTGSIPLLAAGQPFSTELRVRFPGPTDTLMAPTQLSGALWTLSSGSTSWMSVWYEKSSVASSTGNLFLTSSAGRLQLTSASLFDGGFCNLAVVREFATGSISLYANRYDDGELVYSSSSVSLVGAVGCPPDSNYNVLEIGSSVVNPSRGEFWGQELRLWGSALQPGELLAHAAHFESYGREISYTNSDLRVHWRMADGASADGAGHVYPIDSTLNAFVGTGSNFVAGTVPYDKFLLDYAYIPSIDYGWNQEKVRVFDGALIDPQEAFHDERFVALEFNMYDALNEDISHVMSSYDELGNFLGLPVNRYRDDYEGLRQMRETYFKRLQGPLSFRLFVDMLDFFDTSFTTMVEKLLPARAIFRGDEMVVESHMLERPKYQYQLRPIVEGVIDISGSISITDRGDDFD